MDNDYIYTNPYPDDITGCILDENILFNEDTWDMGLYKNDLKMLDYISTGVYIQMSVGETSDAIRLMQYNLKGWGV